MKSINSKIIYLIKVEVESHTKPESYNPDPKQAACVGSSCACLAQPGLSKVGSAAKKYPSSRLKEQPKTCLNRI